MTKPLDNSPSKLSRLFVEKSRLQGRVEISGAKNSALRLLAASLLTSEDIELFNFPNLLLDSKIHVSMLEALGKSCKVKDSHIRISENALPSSELRWEGRSIRNTLLILGALVARTGSGAVPLPGGCDLGGRKYDLHIDVLQSLGASVWENANFLHAEAPKGLVGTDIYLTLRSTGATENAILCGSLASGVTRIWNPHIRPEINDLIAMLRVMGVSIEVRGQESIIVRGSTALKGARHSVIPDNMEALTWLIGSAITDGDVEIVDFPFNHLEVPLIHLQESGVKLYRCDRNLIVRGSECFPIEISTGPYPGINSDMQPLFAVLGTVANGKSRIIDLRFPGRYNYAGELRKMGAQMDIADGFLVIEGGKPLTAAEVKASDLRAGAALLLAGMCAEGTTVIEDAWQIERGYNDFANKIISLGGNIRCD